MLQIQLSRLLFVMFGLASCVAVVCGVIYLPNASKPVPNAVKSMGAILEAIDNYGLAFGRLPANILDDNGNPTGSWRFAVMPYLESVNCNFDVDQPWNAPINSCVAAMRIPYYCWKRSALHDKSSFDTNVFAVSGPGTAFSTTNIVGRDDLPEDLILLVSISQSDTHWMEPRDIKLREFPEEYTVNNFTPESASGVDRITLAFADGEVWQLTSDVPLKAIGSFFTVRGANKNQRGEFLGDYCVFKKAFPYIGP